MISGKYTTGYIHYPTYFFAAAGFQHVWEHVTGDDKPLDGYRAFSALVMTLGVVASALMAWMLRLRGAALVAATALPVAATLLVYNGAFVNPASAAVLCGALIGGTGLRWALTGRGFWWFAAASAFAASVGVVHSLPAGGFLIAMLVLLVLRAFRYDLAGVGWRPRWWHLITITLTLVAPIVLWGLVINATATISNADLYSFFTPAGPSQVFIGALGELASLHTPWRFTVSMSDERSRGLIIDALDTVGGGLPLWITILIFGTIVVNVMRTMRARRTAAGSGRPPTFTATSSGLLVAASLAAGVVVYPAALRISNWVTMGFDHPIVDRYSVAFAAALGLAVLCMRLPRGWTVTLAVLAAVAALAAVAPGWA